jgi:hypothetical protein
MFYGFCFACCVYARACVRASDIYVRILHECLHACVYTCTCVRVCMHVCIYIYVYMHVDIRMYVGMLCTDGRLHAGGMHGDASVVAVIAAINKLLVKVEL